MATQEDINHQVDLLNTHRRNLQHYLRQKASLGPSQITTGQDNGIRDARNKIARIKSILYEWHIPVEDQPDDLEVAQMKEVQVNISADKVMIVIPISEFGRMLQVNPELLQFVVYKS